MPNFKSLKVLFRNPLYWGGLFFAAVVIGLSFFYFTANREAPVQRDGAHFIFMANNIAYGQAPYWAGFDTKNPMVEIYWSPFIYLLRQPLGLIGSVRLAEQIWMSLTASLIFVVVVTAYYQRESAKPAKAVLATLLAAGGAALAYLTLISDTRVTDDGLNIAMYQGLPELAIIALIAFRPKAPGIIHGILIGSLWFLAWFVKQTSGLTVVLVLAMAWVILRRSLGFRWWVGIVVGLLLGLAAFGAHLYLSDTFDNYWLVTHFYRSTMVPVLLPQFPQNFWNAYTPAVHFDLHWALANHRLFTGLATLILSGFATFEIFRGKRIGWTTEHTVLSLGTAWMLGSWLQAVAGLTFYHHYFLTSLAPVCLVFAMLLVMHRNLFSTLIACGVIGVAALLAWNYTSIAAINPKRGFRSPIAQSTREIMRHISPVDRIFNWSLLPHVLIAHGEPSSYELNMQWPYVMKGLPVAERTALLRKTLERTPPDVVIAIQENISSNEFLELEAMTVERLKDVTGFNYNLEYETTRRPGRYGDPVRIFRREQSDPN